MLLLRCCYCCYCCCLRPHCHPAGAYTRVDTKATTSGTMRLPVSLLLLRTSPAFGSASGCEPLVPVTRMQRAQQMKDKGIVLQIMPDCLGRGISSSPEIWDWLLVRLAAALLAGLLVLEG